VKQEEVLPAMAGLRFFCPSSLVIIDPRIAHSLTEGQQIFPFPVKTHQKFV